MKILLFTDSRGQHKAQNSKHQVYGEMLDGLDGIDLESYYCPFKWTTTLDFLDSFDFDKLKNYDSVILHTGIVDFSPRMVSSAIGDLYNNSVEENTCNLDLNTRNYSEKIKNWKKPIFDKVFGSELMEAHLGSPFESFYKGEKTINMYGIEMAKLQLLPLLNSIENLLFINTNKIVHGWDGDYPRERPKNMDVIHEYCNLLSENIDQQLDLSQWSDNEVKLYTTDNIHFTEEGNIKIFNGILEHIDRCEDRVEEKPVTVSIPNFWNAAQEIVPFRSPEIITQAKKLKILETYGLDDKPIASIVIGFRLKVDEPSRLENLRTLLDWTHRYFPSMFEIILVEQDSVKRFEEQKLENGEIYKFIHNPSSYNRGWGYNVAVKKWVTTPVVVACDTDLLFGSSFLQSILQCYRGKDFVSPYRNVYYSSADEGLSIRENLSFANLVYDEKKLNNPVSITGGILIARTEAYLRFAGFEQYMGYACEDRAFDAAICELADSGSVLVQNETYLHLYHPLHESEKKNFTVIYKHLVENYGCKYYPDLNYSSYIHQYCKHSNSERIAQQVQFRRQSDEWGDENLYQKSGLGVNGIAVPESAIGRECKSVKKGSAIFPESFSNLNDYEAKEIYSNQIPPTDGLKDFYNKYKGERCVIIGNGPSLNKIDLGKIQSEYTFGVNSLYYKTRESGFMPTFFVVEDSSVMKENIAEIKKYNASYKFFPTIYKDLHGESKNSYFFKMNRGFYEKSSPNYCVPRFSTDFSKIAYCGQSVTFINLQLAYYMGFTEIYLVGMDFSYMIPESHSRTGDVLVSDSDDPNHFHKDYFGKGKSWKDPKLDRVLMNYKQAKLVYDGTGRKIYNATKGGKLDIFPRVDYDSVFRYQLSGSYRTRIDSDEKISIPIENEKTDEADHALLFIKGSGLISQNESVLNFGFFEKVKEARLRSLRTFELLACVDVDIEFQEVSIDTITEVFGSENILFEVVMENGDLHNLGVLCYNKIGLFGDRKLKLKGAFEFVSLKSSDGYLAGCFVKNRKRIILEMLDANHAKSEDCDVHTFISPITYYSHTIVAYKDD